MLTDVTQNMFPNLTETVSKVFLLINTPIYRGDCELNSKNMLTVSTVLYSYETTSENKKGILGFSQIASALG